jgi:hypothetical protein
VTLIQKRLNIEAVIKPGKAGQFEVFADGERVAERGGNWFTRSFGAGYPDLDSLAVVYCERSSKSPSSVAKSFLAE